MRTIIFSLLAFVVAGVAHAQDMAQEAIVVTGSRYVERYESFTIPHVSLLRRADFAVANLTISSDTRDADGRSQELRSALQGLARAQNRNVSLGILDDSDQEDGQTRVRPFSVEQAMLLLAGGSRVDTSQITIVLRTPVSADDTTDSVTARLDAFRQATPRPGRVEAFRGQLELVIINPPQYRAAVVSEIAADATRIAQGLGEGYGAQLEGLESALAWKRAGDLDLRLFVPYRLVIMPRRAA